MTGRLAVVVASQGRPTLERTVASVAPQLCPGDRLIVDLNNDGAWGAHARNRQIDALQSAADWPAVEWLMFLDDDDVYVPGALEAVRARVGELPADYAVHVFRMRYADGSSLWQEARILPGNVGTPMVVVPAITAARFGLSYIGDCDFIQQAAAEAGRVVWHPETIALIRPT